MSHSVFVVVAAIVAVTLLHFTVARVSIDRMDIDEADYGNGGGTYNNGDDYDDYGDAADDIGGSPSTDMGRDMDQSRIKRGDDPAEKVCPPGYICDYDWPDKPVTTTAKPTTARGTTTQSPTKGSTTTQSPNKAELITTKQPTTKKVMITTTQSPPKVDLIATTQSPTEAPTVVGGGSYTVSGRKCYKQECHKNTQGGYYYCEYDNTGAWEFCCRPNEQCQKHENSDSPSRDPWCYVGVVARTQWRPCTILNP